MSQNNKPTNKIYLYSVPLYAQYTPEYIKMNKEIHININDIDNKIKQLGPQKCLYEWIENNLVRMNIDIDGTESDIKQISNAVIKASKELLNMDVDLCYTQNYGYGHGPNDINKIGNSYHLVINNLSCDRQIQSHFWRNIQALNPDTNFNFDVKCLVREKGYFRFPHQYKEGLPGSEHIILQGEMKSFALNYVTECEDITDKLKLLYIKEVNESNARLNARKNMDNVTIDATDDNIQKIREFSELLGTTYIEDYHEWRNMVWSIRAMGEGFRNLAIEISKRSSSYSSRGFLQAWKNYKDNRGNKITSNSFFYFCKEGNEQQFKLLCKKWNMKETDRESIKEIDEYFNIDKSGINYNVETSKYICCDVNNNIKMSNNLKIDKHIVLKADMGKGKTQFIKEILKYGCLINGNRKPNVLFISSRKSFANFICSEFDVCNYLDFVEDSSKYRRCNKLCVQLESLVKIDESINYDHIILDECESILKQFSSPTLKQVGLTYSIFESLLKKAKRVVYADAFISNRTLNYVREIRNPGENIHMIHNIIPCIYNKQAIQIPSVQFEKNIIQLLNAGKNVYVPSCSKTKLNQLEIETLRKCPNIKSVFHHSDNDDEIMDMLKNVNECWSEYNLIGCTATVTVGVSYNIVDHFNHIMVDARNCGGPCPRDIMQMIRRIRHTDGNLKFSLPYHTMMTNNKKHSYKLISDLNDENKEKIDIIKASLATEEYQDKTLNTTLDLLLEAIPEGLKIILHGNLRENIMSQFHFKNMILKLFELLGYEVKTCEEIKEDKAENDIKFGRDYVKEFDDILDIPRDQISLIVSRQKKKHVRLMQPRIDKYFYNDKFSISLDKSLRAEIFFNVYQNRYKKHIINNIQYEKSNLSHLEKTKLEIEKSDYNVTSMNMISEKTKLIKSLNGVLKINHSQDTTTIIEKADMDNAKTYLKKNIKMISTLYNTTVNKDSKGDAYLHLIKNIYNDWSNNTINAHTKDRTRLALTFKMKGYNYYNYLILPNKLNNIDIFEENI